MYLYLHRAMLPTTVGAYLLCKRAAHATAPMPGMGTAALRRLEWLTRAANGADSPSRKLALCCSSLTTIADKRTESDTWSGLQLGDSPPEESVNQAVM